MSKSACREFVLISWEKSFQVVMRGLIVLSFAALSAGCPSLTSNQNRLDLSLAPNILCSLDTFNEGGNVVAKLKIDNQTESSVFILLDQNRELCFEYQYRTSLENDWQRSADMGDAIHLISAELKPSHQNCFSLPNRFYYPERLSRIILHAIVLHGKKESNWNVTVYPNDPSKTEFALVCNRYSNSPGMKESELKNWKGKQPHDVR